MPVMMENDTCMKNPCLTCLYWGKPPCPGNYRLATKDQLVKRYWSPDLYDHNKRTIIGKCLLNEYGFDVMHMRNIDNNKTNNDG